MIRAVVYVGMDSHRVGLAQVGLDDDRLPWRIEAPGENFDGWLMSSDELSDIWELRPVAPGRLVGQ